VCNVASKILKHKKRTTCGKKGNGRKKKIIESFFCGGGAII
jgi:hypothetical protein